MFDEKVYFLNTDGTAALGRLMGVFKMGRLSEFPDFVIFQVYGLFF